MLIIASVLRSSKWFYLFLVCLLKLCYLALFLTISVSSKRLFVAIINDVQNLRNTTCGLASQSAVLLDP
jgi:hypothetical protein